MNDEDDPWIRLVKAAQTPAANDHAKPTSRINIKSLRESVQSLLLAFTWRKWSFFAAILAAIIFLVFFILRDDPPAPEPIIPTEPPAAPDTP
ncbi:hypothetical protein N9B63_06130 [Akkermansiaceae bacterium]|jgi:hypothetical protein|nr:hypothetical protein [Akkermansiaceae bacterium]MDA7868753.1 hypothetical protein [bacterium]MDA7930401.1 hypothetical protein [Akkermansiaceae bacterium]